MDKIRKLKLPIQEFITTDLIQDILVKHAGEKHRVLKMKDYYRNRNKITRRRMSDPNKPNNRLSHGYAKYITDTYSGYFLGEPITYKCEKEDTLDRLTEVFKYNDEHANNIQLAQEASICGYAYELLYIDDEGELRFKALPTEEVVVVYDNTIEERIQFAIRYYDVYTLDNEELKEVIVYTPTEIIMYDYTGNALYEKQVVQHYFGDVPIADYENNEYRLGDFEPVLSLIDAYDQANSDTANDFEYFTNALLVVSGVTMSETDEEGRPLNFKDNRVLNFLDSNSKAEYLIKNINDTALENYKNRLNNDIHKFTSIIDISDENFASNLSGVAMKYKLMGMENTAGIKESKFRKGIMRRLELMFTILNLQTASGYLYTEISPVFTRSIPVNEAELVNMAKSLYGIVSEPTLLSLLPFIEDVQQEIDALAKEKEERALELADYQFAQGEEGEQEKEAPEESGEEVDGGQDE